MHSTHELPGPYQFRDESVERLPPFNDFVKHEVLDIFDTTIKETQESMPVRTIHGEAIPPQPVLNLNMPLDELISSSTTICMNYHAACHPGRRKNTLELDAEWRRNHYGGIIPNLYILMAETLMKLIKPDNLDEYVKLGYRVVLQAFNSSSDTPIANVRGWLHILRPWYNQLSTCFTAKGAVQHSLIHALVKRIRAELWQYDTKNPNHWSPALEGRSANARPHLSLGKTNDDRHEVQLAGEHAQVAHVTSRMAQRYGL